MVKKAKELKSLDELNISSRAKSYFRKNEYSLEKLVWTGREDAYHMSNGNLIPKHGTKSRLELVEALNEAGFIRHDVNSYMFCIGKLYYHVYSDERIRDTYPVWFNDLCCTIEEESGGITTYHYNYHMGNENYENLQSPPDSIVEKIKSAMASVLTDLDLSVILYACGFESEKPLLSHSGIKFRRDKAIRELRRPRPLYTSGKRTYVLPPILEPTN